MAIGPSRASGLLGRRDECAALDRVVAGVRAGRSHVLVLGGEAGAGKTALLDHLVARSSGCRVARAAGVESEMELAYSGLHQLCAPMLDRLERLPGPQRDALGAALGRTVGDDAPDRFLVGLAVLSLLSEAAEERPLICAIDDAQWQDRASAQTLAFVARRLLAEPVGMVFAVREPTDGLDLAGLPRLDVGGLGDGDARTLLASTIRGPLDVRLRDRIVAESRGNPLALLELPRGLTHGELAGGFGPAGAMPLTNRIELSFTRQLEALPDESRLLLLVAAADPVGDAAVLWRAADRLGLATAAADPATAAGLLEIGLGVRFRHPLMRSAAYRAATVSDRQRVHAALAEATDPDTDPDRRAWHRAHAAGAPDEGLAVELERSAGRAQARGGIAAVAAFLTRATELTPDPARRGARALAAAQAKLDIAATDTALELLATARLGPLDELEQARLERMLGQIAFTTQRGRDAPQLLLDAARRLDPLDVEVARETHLEAMAAAMFAGRLGARPDVRDVGLAARAAPAAPEPPRAVDLLVDGLATRFTEGYEAGVAPIRRALQAFLAAGEPAQDDMRWLWLACRLAQDVWDDELWHELATSGCRVPRETGALSLIPIGNTYRAALHVHEGAFDAASALISESDAIVAETNIAPLGFAKAILAAWRGQETEAMELYDWGRRSVIERGEGMALGGLSWARALLYNGLGRHADALVAAQQGCEHDDVGMYAWSLVELIEAGSRADAPDAAAAALDRLSERTSAVGTDWALGIEAGSRALLSDDSAAEPLYQEAIERLGRTRGAVHLARAQLRYGEWLRRENRRVDAREQLRAAHDAFSGMGSMGFAERARGELLATGETLRRRAAETRDELTAQEAQVARLAGDGHTNAEIGAQLFLSPRTVEYHLHKVFVKLDVSSRKELRTALVPV
jgi:DNA-binding CsgD family transcriptional regulator